MHKRYLDFVTLESKSVVAQPSRLANETMFVANQDRILGYKEM